MVENFSHILNKFLQLLLLNSAKFVCDKDHSEGSFRLSAGGGPQHLACVDGGASNGNRGSAQP